MTSDVSARGVDYPGVTRVIQIGVPVTPDVYVHRVGRTGRSGAAGRGDLVLLPWESGYVTWEMNNIPFKTVTVDEIESQVEELAAEADNRSTHPRFHLAAVKSVEEKVLELLPKIDEEAVRETLMAGFGYYLAKSAQLRVKPGVIIDGLKEWTVDALGLSEPPHIPKGVLLRLNVREESGRFGSRRPPYPGSTNKTNGSGWGGRGNQRRRDDRSGQHGGHRFSKDFDREDSHHRDSYRRGRHSSNRTV